MIVAANYGTVADIEILVTLLAVVGAALSILNVRDAVGDLKAMHGKGPQNGRWAIARTSVHVEVARLVIQAIFAFIGVLAMLLPDADLGRLSWQAATTVIVTRWGIVICVALVAYQSLENRRMRQRTFRSPEHENT